MTKITPKQKTDFDRLRSARGVTLVELLIVISILTIVAAIMIPRLRVINKDRNIREAARVVASAFAKASTRAINDGSSGLVIVPNPNFVGGTSKFIADNDEVQFAGTRIYQMRKLPAYIGDDENAMATTPGSGAGATIFKPFEQDTANVVRQFDEISFNGSSYRYLINDVTDAGMTLTLALDFGSAPAPQLGTGVPFVIHRQPRRMESSLVELPDGYLIDLRYSGRPLSGNAAFATYGSALNQNVAGEVEIHFNASGGVERMFFMDELQGSVAQVDAQPMAPLYWFISQFEPSAIDVATGSYLPGRDPIMSESSKWVTVDSISGSVNVASNAVPANSDGTGGGPIDFDGDGNVDGATGTLSDYIFEAQTIARTRQSANQ